MRKAVSKPKFIRKGKIVRIELRLSKDTKHARLGVWSTTRGGDYSPHVPYSKMGIVVNGMPTMVAPMFTTLDEGRPSKRIEFISDDDLLFLVRQEVDSKSEKTAIARVYSPSKVRLYLERWHITFPFRQGRTTP